MKTISAVITKVPAKQHVWRGFGKTMLPSSEPASLNILPCEAAAYMLGVSLFPLRVINSKMASRASLPWCRMACTRSVIGISTP